MISVPLEQAICFMNFSGNRCMELYWLACSSFLISQDTAKKWDKSFLSDVVTILFSKTYLIAYN